MRSLRQTGSVGPTIATVPVVLDSSGEKSSANSSARSRAWGKLVSPSPTRSSPQIPAEAGNKSCCAQSPAACIAGLWTAPLPAQSSPASQQSGDGGLPGKKIALDLQLADLAVQIVNDLLRIPDRRRPVAARKQLARTLYQLLFPVADHRRMYPKLHRQLSQGLLPRKRRHRHSRLKFRAVLFPLDAHVSRPFGPVSL